MLEIMASHIQWVKKIAGLCNIKMAVVKFSMIMWDINILGRWYNVMAVSIFHLATCS